jgi:hypothetical protein
MRSNEMKFCIYMFTCRRLDCVDKNGKKIRIREGMENIFSDLILCFKC